MIDFKKFWSKKSRSKDYLKQKNIADERLESERNFIAGEVQASSIQGTYYRSYKPYPVYSKIYGGENNWGNLGSPIIYSTDFYGLAARSWQTYYESEFAQTVIKAYVSDVIGKGLTLESKPIQDLIKSTDASFDRDNFVSSVEMLYSLYSQDKFVSYNKMQNLNELASTAFFNALIGGDVLIIQRY